MLARVVPKEKLKEFLISNQKIALRKSKIMEKISTNKNNCNFTEIEKLE
jgi:hypothetical protein